MKKSYSRVFQYCSMLQASISLATVSVTWIEKPPATVSVQEEFQVAWNVQDLSGSFHALCTLCPKDQGPHCKKGSQRYDSEVFNGHDQGQFHAKMSFPSSAPSGTYYATAYGAYSKTQYYNTEPVEIVYASSQQTVSSTSTSASSSQSSSSASPSTSSAPNSGVVLMTPPIVPYGYQAYPYAEEENNVTVNNEDQHTQQDAQQHHQNKQEQRSQTYPEHSQQQSVSQGSGSGHRQGSRTHSSGHARGHRS